MCSGSQVENIYILKSGNEWPGSSNMIDLFWPVWLCLPRTSQKLPFPHMIIYASLILPSIVYLTTTAVQLFGRFFLSDFPQFVFSMRRPQNTGTRER